MDLCYLDSRQAVSQYLHERRRREQPPSLLSTDPEMPRAPSPVPPSGRYEQLIRLLVGVDEVSIRALFMLEFGWAGHEDRRYSVGPGPEEDDAEERQIPMSEPVAIRPTSAMVARQLGVGRRDVERMVSGALQQVAENLGRMRSGS
jgi:hypothetical protein